MSNTGQAALTIVGTVVGYYFGYPQLGFMLGSLAGQALFPTQLPTINGPRLNDTRTTMSQMGGAVQEVLGVDAVAGTVIWLGPVNETANSETTGGKGGPEQDVKTFHYSQPIAIGLTRGPMGGIYQIFENGKLVYDLRPQQDDETEAQYTQRAVEASAFAQTFTLYPGNETQLPDPIIEGYEGVGNVPAFRGLMYIVFHDRALREEQGLRHPNFKFVVYQDGLSDCEEVTEYSQYELWPWKQDKDNPLDERNDHVVTLVSSGLGTGGAGDCPSAGVKDSVAMAVADMSADRGVAMKPFGISGANYPPPEGFSVSYTDKMGAPLPKDEETIYLFYSFTDANLHVAANNLKTAALMGGGPNQFVQVCTNAFTGGTSSRHVTCMYGGDEPVNPEHWEGRQASDDGYIFWTWSGAITVKRLLSAPDDPCHYLPEYPGAPGFCIRNGRVIEGSPWTLVTLNEIKVLQTYAAEGGTGLGQAVTRYPLGPLLKVGDPDDNEEFWTDHYDAARALGLMDGGKVYGVDYPIFQHSYYERTFQICSLVPEGISLDRVVRYICNRCGLTDDQIDVTDLASTNIIGYTLSRVMNGRDGIEPLRLVGYFDIVESGTILKFVKRGKPHVATLTGADLAAHETGTDVPAAIATRKVQDSELPRQLRLHYRAPSRDYEDGEQLSPTRLTTKAINDVDVECPISITDQMAAEAAEVNWADPWAGRWGEQFQLDRSFLTLEGSDCILVPVDGRLERLRILSIDDELLRIRKVEAVRDDGNAYVSVAIADPPTRPAGSMEILEPTDLYLLDLPALRPEDDDAGIYAIAAPRSQVGTWRGAIVFRSVDGGGSYQSVETVTIEATTGVLASALEPSLTTSWDDENVLTVVLRSGSFESHTDEEVLGGANVLAVGADGRWEIVQFATATQVGELTWELSHLLRGRRGTEHVLGSSVLGDTVVLMDGPGVIRLSMQPSAIGQTFLYRAVTSGAAIATATDVPFVTQGEALVPLSPVTFGAVRELNGDVTLTWLRRDRLGDELPYGGGDVPMSETTLSFVVSIIERVSQIEVREITVSAETATYTLAQQMTDLGSPLSGTFDVRISQISSVVGAGTPLVESVTV